MPPPDALPNRMPPTAGPLRTDLRARAAYAEGAGIYRILPAAVGIPRSAEDLEALLDWARRAGVGLVPRGAGSGMTGGNVGPGLVVDLTQLAPRVLEIHPDDQLALTGAAVTFAELNRAAAKHGLRLPPEPSSGRWATLGGMVATNAAGARSVRYGPVRPWVRGLEVLTADGTRGWLDRNSEPSNLGPAVRRFVERVAPRIHANADLIRARYPKTRKNTAGYALDAFLDSGDVLDLLVGSEGTLGIITAIKWRLDRIPAHRAALALALRELDGLSDVIAALVTREPSALELLDRTFLGFVQQGQSAGWIPAGTEALLLVEFEREHHSSLHDTVGHAVRAVSPLVAQIETALTEGDIARLWEVRHRASPLLARLPESRRSLQVIEDGCVPVPALGRYVGLVRQAAAEMGLEVVLFGHAGDGHLHVNVLADTTRPDWAARVQGLFDRVTAAVLEWGGTPSGEHGDGRLRAGVLEGLYGPEILGLFHEVKEAFDPEGVLNPGVMTRAGAVLENLKVGAGAVELPEDVAAGLRRIERDAGYDQLRLTLAERSVPS